MAYTSAQLQTIYSKVHLGLTPSAATIVTLNALAAETTALTKTDAQAYRAVLDTADNDTSVAIGAYQYFTGVTPTQAGLAFLVNSTTNATDLNDAYYTQFSIENRYINFAQNLGLVGDGKAFFAAAYTGFTFAQVVATAYEIIVGSAQATAAGINPTTAIADITGRLPYFTALAAERFVGLNQDLAIKAAVVGYIMSEGAKANVGAYANATGNMLTAIDAGTATYNNNLTTAYSTGAVSGGSGSGAPQGTPNAGFPTTAPTPASSVAVDLNAGAVTLTGVAANAGFAISASNGVNALTLTLTDASGTFDVVNLAIASTTAAGLTIGKITVAGVETLNVTSGGSLSGGGTINVLNLDPVVDVFKTVAVFGSQPLYVDTGAYTTSVFLNGGGATGELVLDAADITNVAVTSSMAGGIRNDTFWPVTLAGAGGAVQLLYGGGGGDVFNLGATHTESNVVTYKTGAESLYDITGTAGSSGTSTANTGKMDVVNNFVSGRDKIDVSTLSFTSAQMQIVDRTTASTTTLETLAATATFFQDAFSTTRSAVAAHVGADIYLYIDTNKNGAYDASSDLVVKLVGLASIALTDIIR